MWGPPLHHVVSPLRRPVVEPTNTSFRALGANLWPAGDAWNKVRENPVLNRLRVNKYSTRATNRSPPFQLNEGEEIRERWPMLALEYRMD